MKKSDFKVFFYIVAIAFLFAQTLAANELIPTGSSENQSSQIEAPPMIDTVSWVDRVRQGNAFEIKVSGKLLNGCHHLHEPIVNVDQAQRLVVVSLEGYQSNGYACTKMIEYFDESIPIADTLEVGEYAVIFVSGTHVSQTKLEVLEPSVHLSIDDPSKSLGVAHIETASFVGQEDGSIKVKLSGRHPYLMQGCVELAHTHIVFVGDDTMILRPESYVSKSDRCEQPDSFSSHVEIGRFDTLEKARSIIVQSGKGKSIYLDPSQIQDL